MFDKYHLPHDVYVKLFTYFDLESAKSIRSVSKNGHWLVYDLILSNFFLNGVLQVRFDDGFYVEFMNGDRCYNLGSFRCYIGRPYSDWLAGNGDYDFTYRWKLFVGLFGAPKVGVLCDHLRLIDDTNLRDGKHHVPFIHWVPLTKFMHPTSSISFYGPQQFFGKCCGMELLFPTTMLPREIELSFREVEGIDLFNRLIPLARAFSNCVNDVNAEITIQSGPDFDAKVIVVKTQKSHFSNYLSDADISFNQPAHREATYTWNNSSSEYHVVFEQILSIRLVFVDRKWVVIVRHFLTHLEWLNAEKWYI